MEALDRKRKRSAPEPDRLKNNSADGDKAEAAEESKRSSVTTRPPPSEEEVEEFFTLLRRIHSAAKLSGNVNGKVRSTVFESEFPLTPPLLNGGPSARKMDRTEQGADNGVMIIDLNAVPDEAEEASG